ncbi:hypothetical protein K3495_g11584 [Podosphaera aphanis]|nr:hypothetical protein K3495_g11584 [Podosphaera aphanis]
MTPQIYSYGDHELQSLMILDLHPEISHNDDAFWLIYIHGGAWRDPNITESSFLPTINSLLSNRLISRIKCLASISYRLSSHPEFPQGPFTPANKVRNAKHPDHIIDITLALSFLQKKYNFRNRYILVGHSCGATLAFQIIKSQDFCNIEFAKPSAIIGVAGIYNLRGLRDRNNHPAYQSFLSGAFSNDEKVWNFVSPAKFVDIEKLWPEGKLIVLASSTGDNLVEPAQIDDMEKTLIACREIRLEVSRNILACSHDEIWQTGKLADIINKALEIFFEK